MLDKLHSRAILYMWALIRKRGLRMKFCNFCLIRQSQYTLYKIVLETDKRIYEMGIASLLEKMEDWIFKKMHHLSASQILLLRPDLVHEFFEDYKHGERIKSWFFEEYFICSECYKDYKNHVPTT